MYKPRFFYFNLNVSYFFLSITLQWNISDIIIQYLYLYGNVQFTDVFTISKFYSCTMICRKKTLHIFVALTLRWNRLIFLSQRKSDVKSVWFDYRITKDILSIMARVVSCISIICSMSFFIFPIFSICNNMVSFVLPKKKFIHEGNIISLIYVDE